MRGTIMIILMGLLILPRTAAGEDRSVYDLSLAELAKVKFSTAAALTATEKSKIPASVTTITRQMIEVSGARNLDELLEYYVPNLSLIEHHGSGQHLGLRGIISDLDNKVLMLVNGRVMNHEAVFGAITERFVSMLGDIHHIDVIRGPGSALYGPGAIAGVIDIHTLDATYFEGMDLQVRQGVWEEFTAFEARWGQKFDENRGLFVYYGLDNYRGASGEDAPGYVSSDFDKFDIKAGYIEDLPRHHGSEDLRHKFHLEYTNRELTAFARFVKGGEFYRGTYFFKDDFYLYYQQFTAQLAWSQELTNTLKIKLSGGFDSTQIRRIKNSQEVDAYFPEEEINLNLLFQWTPQPSHSLALGGEIAREYFAYDHLNLGYDEVHIGVNGQRRRPWQTTTSSVFGEYQWGINDQWTLFTGGRADKHTYSEWMLSPRVALAWTPSGRHGIKLIYNESVRKTDDDPLEALVSAGRMDTAELETIKSVEFRHDFTPGDKFTLGWGAFYYSYDALGYSASLGREGPLGTAEAAGVELELTYKNAGHEILISHSYSKLLNLSLADPALIDQNISSEPYGYGDDFLNWSPHITKLNWLWQVSETVTLNTSLQVFWSFPGASDYADYNQENIIIKGYKTPPVYGRTVTDGRQTAFGTSAFLNTGMTAKLSQRLNLGLHFYNILGWVDQTLNKRNRLIQMGQFRQLAPALAVSLRYRF